jgi:hypothetical protein
MRFDEKHSYYSFLFWKNYGDWWHLPGYDGENRSVSCPCGDILQLDVAPPSFCSRVRDFLHRKFPYRWLGRETPFSGPLSRFDSSEFFLEFHKLSFL